MQSRSVTIVSPENTSLYNAIPCECSCTCQLSPSLSISNKQTESTITASDNQSRENNPPTTSHYFFFFFFFSNPVFSLQSSSSSLTSDNRKFNLEKQPGGRLPKQAKPSIDRSINNQLYMTTCYHCWKIPTNELHSIKDSSSKATSLIDVTVTHNNSANDNIELQYPHLKLKSLTLPNNEWNISCKFGQSELLLMSLVKRRSA